MNFLISSAYLKSKLEEIDFDTESVQDSVLTRENLTLKTEKREVKITLRGGTGYFWNENPRGARWSMVKDLVKQVPDQPLVLSFGEDTVNVTFQY